MARHPRLLEVPIGFAHRGASAEAPGNTLDGLPAGGRAGRVRAGVRRLDQRRRRARPRPRRHGRRVAPATADPPRSPGPGCRSTSPPCAISTTEVGTHLPLSLDLKDPDAMEAVLAVADEAGAREKLWICHPEPEVLVAWRERAEGVHLVVSTKLRAFRSGTERAAAGDRRGGTRRRQPAPHRVDRRPDHPVPPLRRADPRLGRPAPPPPGRAARHGHRRGLQRPRRPDDGGHRRRDDGPEVLSLLSLLRSTGRPPERPRPVIEGYRSPRLLSGQTRTKARPTIWSSSMGPKMRLSRESVRLSPITKMQPSGTSKGNSKLRRRGDTPSTT